MKTKCLTLLTVVAVLCAFGGFGAVEIRPGAVAVVAEKKAPPVVQFAAEELTNFLAQALGAPVGVSHAPAEGAAPETGAERGRVDIILGDNEWSRAAGLDAAKLPRDTFVIRAERNRVYILGADDPGKDIRALKKVSFSPDRRGTLFGVYAFLENRAGVRFYFPGELGTVVPKASVIRVDEGEKRVSPVYDIREWYAGHDMIWPGTDAVSNRGEQLNWLRLRMGSHRIPLCHGTRHFKYLERFGESHPEYFALKPNGARHNDANANHPGHFCWNSPIVEEIYRDVKCALTGGKPSDRGIPGDRWPKNVDLEFRYVDIMPQDGQANCVCPVCTAQRARGENAVWAATAKIARRMQEEGVDGTVTQMAYGRNRDVPKFDLPTNIAIQVAVGGAWSMGDASSVAAERKIVSDWVKKLGHKVWLWNYQCKSGGMRSLKGLPQLSMHYWGEYYKTMPDLVIGAFAESEAERLTFNYLNWYVYSRVCWDAHADIDAILDEHHRLMFGPAAAEMSDYYGTLERIWTTEVIGQVRNTPLGPERIVPSLDAVFGKIYSKDVLAKLDAMCAAALAKVPADSLYARRIRLFSAEYVGSIRAAAKAYEDRLAAVANFRAKASRETPIELRLFNLRGKKAKIDRPLACGVTTWRDEASLRFLYRCEEPSLDRVADMKRPNGDGYIWMDNCVELHLCPTGDRKDVCQVMVNTQGSLCAIRYRLLGEAGRDYDRDWGKTVTAKVTREASAWTAEIAIPLAELKGLAPTVPACFSRSRMVSGMSGSAYYIWGPETIKSFVDTTNFGTVEYGRGLRMWDTWHNTPQ